MAQSQGSQHSFILPENPGNQDQNFTFQFLFYLGLAVPRGKGSKLRFAAPFCFKGDNSFTDQHDDRYGMSSEALAPSAKQ
jgi:hypothetical protein